MGQPERSARGAVVRGVRERLEWTRERPAPEGGGGVRTYAENLHVLSFKLHLGCSCGTTGPGGLLKYGGEQNDK